MNRKSNIPAPSAIRSFARKPSALAPVTKKARNGNLEAKSNSNATSSNIPTATRKSSIPSPSKKPVGKENHLVRSRNIARPTLATSSRSIQSVSTSSSSNNSHEDANPKKKANFSLTATKRKPVVPSSVKTRGRLAPKCRNCDELNEKNEEREELLKNVEQKFSTLRTEHSALKSSQSELSKSLGDAQHEVESLTLRNKSLHDEHTHLNNNFLKLQSEYASKEKEVCEAKRVVSEKIAELERLGEENEQLASRNSLLNSGLSEADEKVQALEARLEAKQQEKEKLLLDIDDMKRFVSEAKSSAEKLMRAENKIVTLNQEKRNLLTERTEDKNVIKELSEDVRKKDLELESLKVVVENKLCEIRKLQNTSLCQIERLHELERTNEEKEKLQQKLEGEEARSRRLKEKEAQWHQHSLELESLLQEQREVSNGLLNETQNLKFQLDQSKFSDSMSLSYSPGESQAVADDEKILTEDFFKSGRGTPQVVSQMGEDVSINED